MKQVVSVFLEQELVQEIDNRKTSKLNSRSKVVQFILKKELTKKEVEQNGMGSNKAI